MKILYEVLVPTKYGDTLKPISTKHHKNWDKEVIKITGGLTILKPAFGRWIDNGVEYPEKVIPVRIMCDENSVEPKPVMGKYGIEGYLMGTPPDKTQINKIIKFTLSHYRQKAVMYYVVSDKVNIVYA